ncbi:MULTISPECIES: sulfurtransferase complex subunit TusB [unclassified Marinobacter]|uniref:sulfurtransferase complex subunit TusB n=1 Tax=unclassified Marinobacter TaxID=83889 RepID=UPI001909015E|nr:sulfurtransferase complex subunit TusB [Marinobacter sp. 1-3A]MBK1871639.1 sulfurtransferase complex subunit TusB [Marinobacter sp. 1-3A]
MAQIHTLHILNKAPEHPRSGECLRSLNPGDALLLIENAALALATPGELTAGIPVYALSPDVLARGLAQTARKASLVDFPAMVELTAQAQKVISW